jgi:predicted GNAT family acetyltransferase
MSWDSYARYFGIHAQDVESTATTSVRESPGISKDWVYINAHHNGAKVGSLEASRDKSKNELQIREANVGAEHRGQGHGKALYKAAFKYADNHGLSVRSDTATSPEAHHVWTSLHKEFPNQIQRAQEIGLAQGKYQATKTELYNGRNISYPSGEPVWTYSPKVQGK